jgi:AcrR family transcriptional regulator
VTETRRYSSVVRARHAEDTRRAILEAAAALFARQGYPQTSVKAIADAAGVAVNTVYTSVGGKTAVIHALVEDGADDVMVTATTEQIAQASGAREMLRILGAGTEKVRRRQRQVLDIVLENRTAHPDLAAAAEMATRAVRKRYAVIAQQLLDTGELRAGLTVRRVEQILWFYFGFDAWRTARSLGWTWADTADWLTAQATAALT